LNNLADCSWQLQDYDQARIWARRLFRCAQGSLYLASYKDPIIAVILQKQANQFVRNSMLFLQHFAPAA
jgi:hypothetical protein